jgi:flavin-dependent dehydrogenase
MVTYDAIVVGARCAGSVVAGFLAKGGKRVLLLERNTFPSDVISTHTFFNNTVVTLRELGVMDKLLQENSPRIRHMRAQFEDVVIAGELPAYQGEHDSYCIKRTVLDKVLYDHATSHEGVTGIEGFRVTDLLWENGVVVGVRGYDRDDNVEEFRAKVVIGADGRSSSVRQLAGSEKKTSLRGEYGFCYTYFENMETFDEVAFELYARDEHRAYIFPTNDGHHVVTASFPLANRDLRHAFKSAPEQTMRAYFAEHFPRALQRMEGARPAEGFRGLYALENYWYEGMGAGWVLVGDALCFKDPGVGQGMHDAIYGAYLLAKLLLSREDWCSDAMAADYQAMMEKEFMARYEAACGVTIAAPVPEQELEVFRAVAQNELAKAKFLGFYNYTAEREDVARVLFPQTN